MTCVNCIHFNLKNSRMGLDGLGNCKHLEPYQYKPTNGSCDKFEQASQDVVKRREAYVSQPRSRK